MESTPLFTEWQGQKILVKVTKIFFFKKKNKKKYLGNKKDKKGKNNIHLEKVLPGIEPGLPEMFLF